MRRRLVPIWRNSSLLEHLPSVLLHADKQVADKELVVMENQGTQALCCFQRVANANTNTRRAGCDGKPGNAVPRCFQRVTRRRLGGSACFAGWRLCHTNTRLCWATNTKDIVYVTRCRAKYYKTLCLSQQPKFFICLTNTNQGWDTAEKPPWSLEFMKPV